VQMSAVFYKLDNFEHLLEHLLKLFKLRLMGF
jgi:hypothetical protein